MTTEEITSRIESYASGYRKIADTLQEFPEEMRRYKPSPSQWSIHEIIIHLSDSEAVAYARCRTFIAEPGKQVMGYDQDLWASHLNYHSQNTNDALELFKYLRIMTHALIKDLPYTMWNNVVNHSERGIMKFYEWLHTYDDHVTKHIGQMNRVYKNWQELQAEHK